VCAALVPLRASVPNTDIALVLVAAVVAVAANGHRLAGLLASAVAAAAFDFFLTAPFQNFAIHARVDVETTVLLLVVGAGVTEIAVRGRRSRLRAATDERLLDAIGSTSAVASSASGPYELIQHVTDQVQELLGLRACKYEATRYGGMPRLQPDGRIRVGGSSWDVDEYGMPDTDVELLAAVAGTVHGRLVLSPDPGVVPTAAARRCAALLAEQLAGSLATPHRPARTA
jgi:hypothetical protein